MVLLADDEPISREFLAEALAGLGVEVHAVADGVEAVAALSQRAFDYVFTDLKMPGQDGVAVLVEAKRRQPDLPVVLVTAHGTLGTAVEALRKGADDLLEKPVAPEELELCLLRLRDRRRLLRENRFFRAESVGEELLVAGPAMRRVVDLVERVARSRATVLVAGESGTGKERVAALLHQRSDRADGPFVKLNCAALPETLLESELFGHEAGAFTGATRRREGRFEVADGGTLFLDEVGEMPPAMQAKLLRVLQEGEFQRVGGNHTVRVDVRVVAATNRDLAQAVREGRFREDLYYRLNVVPVTLPALRERREEIVPLARRFLARGVALEPEAEAVLAAHGWPGNVRELQNVIQRACLLCEDGVVRAELLREWLGGVARAVPAPASPATAGGDPIQALVGRRLTEVEDELILATLAQCGGNRTRAAAALGIGVRTLFNRLAGLGKPAGAAAPRT
ncbi:MAG: sigma-54-dependent Fis family transcriptional regulator [Planctomycetes bacterium]|nr:sigma-54-dependent Fis family transcriptional regulator [Planctomycetota bacterium]